MEINKTIKPDFKTVLQLPEQTLKYLAKSDMGRDRWNGVLFKEGFMYVTDSVIAYKRPFVSEGTEGKKLTLAGEFVDDESGMGTAIKNAFAEQEAKPRQAEIKVSVEKLSHLLSIAKLQNINEITLSIAKDEKGAMILKQGDRTYLLMPIIR